MSGKENTMKKSVFLCMLTATALLVLGFSPSFSQEAADILERMIDAQGGRSALEKIQDTVLTGYVEMVQMGLGGSLKTYQKEPNKMRQDATVQGTVVTQAFDGETAWTTNPITGQTEELPPAVAEDFGRSALGNDSLLNPEKFGITYTFIGKQLLDGRDGYVLSQNFSDGFKARLIIDAETYLLHKTITTSINEMGEEVEVETLFSDYINVDGKVIAHTIVTYQGGEEFMKMEIAEIKFNTGLEDSWFEMEWYKK